jgi:transcriptional regulator
MDQTPAKYAARSSDDVLRLVVENPLAWVVSTDGPFATPLPLRPVKDADGGLAGLVGHYARSNRQWERLRDNPRALALFMGPHAYVSPSWMSDRVQAPTWNYASAVFAVELTFIDDEAELRALLVDLIDAMEAGRDNAWSLPEVDARYAGLSRGIVGFHARIVGGKATFKLGQDERDDVYVDILEGLKAEGREDLTAWMTASNPGRA